MINEDGIVSEVAKETNFTKEDIAEIVDSVFYTIIKLVASGEKVSIHGFGSFQPRKRDKRNTKNPKTGEPFVIPACTVVGFKVAKNFKETINT